MEEEVGTNNSSKFVYGTTPQHCQQMINHSLAHRQYALPSSSSPSSSRSGISAFWHFQPSSVRFFLFSFFFPFFFGWLWFRNATNINDQTKLLPEIVTRNYFYPFLPLIFSSDNDHEISGKGGDLGFSSRFLGFLDLWIFWIWKVTQPVGRSVFPFAASISSAQKVWNWCHTFLMDFFCTFFLLQILPKVKFCKWSACWEQQGVLSDADKLFFKPEECSMSVDGSMYPSSSSSCRSYGEICERSAWESRVSCWRQVL